jgi:hypothetical protein
MGIYAAQRGRMLSQLVGDVSVLVWVVGWAVVGFLVDATVGALAGPARETARTAARLSGDLTDAATQAAQVPGVGDALRRPLDSAAGSVGSIVDAANNQVASVERLAAVAGWLTFLVPVLVLLAFWLPRRIRFVRRAAAARRFLDSRADLDLFALRALANQPMHVLAAVSDDPVTAWRQGDRRVIDALAELELRSSGLTMPDRLRG